MTSPDGQEPPQGFTVRSLTGSVYLPNLLFAIGQGAVIPILALLALDLGASTAVAGGIVALRGIGTMVFDLPSGVLVARLGERRSMLLATALVSGIALAVGLRPPLPIYAVLAFLMGCAWSVWLLARLTFATESSPLHYRGRVMSMMGGVSRIGHFVGPLIGGLVVIPLGLGGPFFVQAFLGLAACVALASVPSKKPRPTADRQAEVALREVFRDHRRIFATAGVATVAIQLVRSSREAVIPLWGDNLGIGASQIGLIFAASSAMEMLLFYPVGMLMDRKGRKWAALPCLVLLSLGIGLIPVTRDFVSLAIVAMFIGVANGIGAGINMTLGSDLSPSIGRSQFFGLWRLVTDMGTAGGPLVVAITTSLASLGAAAVAVSGIGAAGALVLWLAVPETLADDP